MDEISETTVRNLYILFPYTHDALQLLTGFFLSQIIDTVINAEDINLP